MSSNKTECGSYNEDDFVQHVDALDELTVTITLCEYRNLISENTRLDMTLGRVQEEKAELEKKLQAAAEVVKAYGNVLMRRGEDQGDDEAREAE